MAKMFSFIYHIGITEVYKDEFELHVVGNEFNNTRGYKFFKFLYPSEKPVIFSHHYSISSVQNVLKSESNYADCHYFGFFFAGWGITY